MSMKLISRRWWTVGACTLIVVGMLGLLGCSKKKAEQAQTTTEEVATQAPTSPMVGTYTADMPMGTMTGKLTLTLNADSTAMMSMDMMNNQPAMVENGRWMGGAGANMVDVAFQKDMGGTMTTVTVNLVASGDTLTVTNSPAVGLGAEPVKLMKQAAGEEHAH